MIKALTRGTSKFNEDKKDFNPLDSEKSFVYCDDTPEDVKE